MNEKLSTATTTQLTTTQATPEDYRYETAYVTPASAKATEANSGLYRYASAGSLGGGVGAGSVNLGVGAPYRISAVPTEFGGTLKSSKGSGGSPRKSGVGVGGVAGGKKSANGGSSSSYCSCFGSTICSEFTFWPAVLANLGICALLVGYIFIGSFVFLSIENSARDDVAAIRRVEDASSMWNFAQQQRQKQQRVTTAAATATSNVPQEPPQLMAAASATWKSSKDNTTTSTATTASKTTTKTTTKAKSSNLQHDTLLNAAAYLAVSDAETDIDSMSSKDKQQQHQQQQQRWQLDNSYNNDYELQTLRLQNEEQQLQQDQPARDEGEAEDVDVDADEDAEYKALAAVEDVERQRTVDNIWDITVSLNILYKENWTKLAALEIQKFQDQLVKRLVMDLTLSTTASGEASTGSGGAIVNAPNSRDTNAFEAVPMHQNAKHFNGQRQQQQHWHHYPQLYGRMGKAAGVGRHKYRQQQQFEWNFATAFLYSLTVVTTVGYGSISPRTTLGRMVTIGYATIGIPLTLIYLSSIGGILAKLARLLCTRALCCWFCTRQRRYCCCHSALHAPSKERELKLKRLHQQQQQESIKMRAQQQQQHLAYCYVRPPALPTQQPQDAATELHMLDASLDTLSVATTTTASRSHSNPFGWSLLAPIGLCVLLMLGYVAFGAVAVALLEDWPLLDGIYFCFMSLTTIGFCDLLPGVASKDRSTNLFAVWFCAIYILTGLTLTAMCVNVLHEEILLRMRVVVKFKKVAAKETKERTFYGAPP